MEEDILRPIHLDIHTASSIGTYECVRNLITRGEVEIDRKNVGGWTPLMYACYIGHDHIVSLLIGAGCNVNLKNQRGHSPLMLAASCGNESVGHTLLKKGAELEAADRNGWTALFHATYSGHQNFVAFLLDQRANMDAAEPSTGRTPFMEAAIEGHEIIVQLFLQHGVNVNAKAYNGDTARTLALTFSYMKIVSLIDNHVMPHSTLRSEPGLGDYLSSSDEVDHRQRPSHQRGSRAKSKGPSIRDGPEAIARMIDRTRTTDQNRYSNLVVPRGYMSFPNADDGETGDTQLSYRDVTSPINHHDYHLDSSGGKDSCDYDDSNAFSKTGAITIKSSSSSSGGLIAALGISRHNSSDSDNFRLHDSGVHNSSQSEDGSGKDGDGDGEAVDGEASESQDPPPLPSAVGDEENVPEEECEENPGDGSRREKKVPEKNEETPGDVRGKKKFPEEKYEDKIPPGNERRRKKVPEGKDEEVLSGDCRDSSASSSGVLSQAVKKLSHEETEAEGGTDDRDERNLDGKRAESSGGIKEHRLGHSLQETSSSSAAEACGRGGGLESDHPSQAAFTGKSRKDRTSPSAAGGKEKGSGFDDKGLPFHHAQFHQSSIPEGVEDGTGGAFDRSSSQQQQQQQQQQHQHQQQPHHHQQQQQPHHQHHHHHQQQQQQHTFPDNRGGALVHHHHHSGSLEEVAGKGRDPSSFSDLSPSPSNNIPFPPTTPTPTPALLFLPNPSMQRRSSCQARLSRLSAGEREAALTGGGGGGKEGGGGGGRHRRRSANSPPTFHRDYGGRGHLHHHHDLGSGSGRGRVSCLSEIPGPHPAGIGGGGYPGFGSGGLGGGLGGGGEGTVDRFHGNAQVPVAAVAPTCLPSAHHGYPPLLPPPSSSLSPSTPSSSSTHHHHPHHHHHHHHHPPPPHQLHPTFSNPNPPPPPHPVSSLTPVGGGGGKHSEFSSSSDFSFLPGAKDNNATTTAGCHSGVSTGAPGWGLWARDAQGEGQPDGLPPRGLWDAQLEGRSAAVAVATTTPGRDIWSGGDAHQNLTQPDGRKVSTPGQNVWSGGDAHQNLSQPDGRRVSTPGHNVWSGGDAHPSIVGQQSDGRSASMQSRDLWAGDAAPPSVTQSVSSMAQGQGFWSGENNNNTNPPGAGQSDGRSASMQSQGFWSGDAPSVGQSDSRTASSASTQGQGFDGRGMATTPGRDLWSGGGGGGGGDAQSDPRGPPPTSSSSSSSIPGQSVPHRGLWTEEGVRRGEGVGHIDLPALLDTLGLTKWWTLFMEQDVDLQVFLSLTDNDLKEIGIKLFGPRKKMTNAIARWHSQAPAASSSLEQAYADRLEGEMQEMAIQLNEACNSVEKLRAQVLQERQLRSVTESCLMEERGGWQRVHQSLLDSHTHCLALSQAVTKLSSLQPEVTQRMSPAATNPASSDMGVTAATDQLCEVWGQHLHDLRQHSAALTHDLDCIVRNPPATGAIHHQPRDGDHDFPC